MDHQKIILRYANITDCQQIFQWANDKITRSVSFSSSTISWKEHKKWFRTKLSDPNCQIFIAITTDNIPLGMIRFDIVNGEGTISINVAPEHRRKGYGKQLLVSASNKMFQEFNLSKIHAYIKTNNQPSIDVFTKSGYRNIEVIEINENKAFHFIINKNEDEESLAR